MSDKKQKIEKRNLKTYSRLRKGTLQRNLQEQAEKRTFKPIRYKSRLRNQKGKNHVYIHLQIHQPPLHISILMRKRRASGSLHTHPTIYAISRPNTPKIYTYIINNNSNRMSGWPNDNSEGTFNKLHHLFYIIYLVCRGVALSRLRFDGCVSKHF